MIQIYKVIKGPIYKETSEETYAENGINEKSIKHM